MRQKGILFLEYLFFLDVLEIELKEIILRLEQIENLAK